MFVIFFTYGSIFSFDYLNKMNKRIIKLEKQNKKLVKKNRTLVKNNNLYSKNNIKLKKENISIKQRVSTFRKELSGKLLTNTKHKLVKLPSTIVPVIGNGIALGLVAYEVNEICKDLQSLRNFEMEITKKNSQGSY